MQMRMRAEINISKHPHLDNSAMMAARPVVIALATPASNSVMLLSTASRSSPIALNQSLKSECVYSKSSSYLSPTNYPHAVSQSYCSPITSSCRRQRLAPAEVRQHLIYHIKLLSPRDTRCKCKWDCSRESSLHPSSKLFLSFSVILSWMAPNSSPLSFGRSSHIDVCVPQLLANFAATLIGVEDLVALEI